MRLWCKYIFHAPYSLQLNPLQCTYFFNANIILWFGLLENNIILVFEHFGNLNRCIFNENTLKLRVWTMCNASWVISKMEVTTEAHNPLIFANSLKEYKIITLIYNRKNMQVRFIMFLCTRGYNSLGDPTRSLMEKQS